MTHPGAIAFEDRATGTTRTTPAAEVPDAIAWYVAGDRRVPVVRIVTADRGGRLEIRRFGPDGELLDVTVGG